MMCWSIPYCREQKNLKTHKRSLKYKILDEEFITPLEVYLVRNLPKFSKEIAFWLVKCLFSTCGDTLN